MDKHKEFIMQIFGNVSSDPENALIDAETNLRKILESGGGVLGALEKVLDIFYPDDLPEEHRGEAVLVHQVLATSKIKLRALEVDAQAADIYQEQYERAEEEKARLEEWVRIVAGLGLLLTDDGLANLSDERLTGISDAIQAILTEHDNQAKEAQDE